MPTSEQRRLVDLSHEIRHGMITYPGLPGPEIGDYLTRQESRETYALGTEFQIGRVTMISNTGTYVDTPFHRFGDGADLARFPLHRLTDLEGIVVRPRVGRRAIDRAELTPYNVRGRAVLVHTEWSRHWGTPEYGAGGHPFLTEEAARWLAAESAALVGIDSLNVDDTADGARPAHTVLLGACIPVVEHLRGLSQLPDAGFRFHAAPPAVAGMGTFPVRAYAVLT
ncbi:cyclase family protein [Streptomyces sp. BK205]|uniref:cyclase family protein n=1 Tax=Streptomyces sp. BK205 TaxID=2512164 RepID=UPI001042E86D|nr:cyclase family protein [Streptomyces sp. BK205]TCR16060.1 kynurenine formamidase [Streptomyces sp. BK205]